MRLRATYTVTVEYEADTYSEDWDPSNILAQEYSQISEMPSILERVPGAVRDVEVVEVEA